MIKLHYKKIFKQQENSKKKRGGQKASKMVLEQVFFMQFVHYESTFWIPKYMGGKESCIKKDLRSITHDQPDFLM